MSIWQAVIPSAVPVTLKSMSPKWSSSPKMSDKTAKFHDVASEINPMAIPDTGFFIWIPASINAIVPAQTVAIDDEPLDSNTSDINRMVYGQSAGIMPFNALCAKFPCPISRRETPLKGLASPVENGGKL